LGLPLRATLGGGGIFLLLLHLCAGLLHLPRRLAGVPGCLLSTLQTDTQEDALIIKKSTRKGGHFMLQATFS
jgi:hypothetical protein